MTLSLPWPDPAMSPNSRKHRLTVAPIRKRYRGVCALMAKAARMNFSHMAEKGLHVRITFHPPDNRKRDLDNMLASFKSGLDGLSDAFGVDDSKWELTIRKGDVRQGGDVSVEVISAQQEYIWRGA